jgi:hypothetical protein
MKKIKNKLNFSRMKTASKQMFRPKNLNEI